MDFDNPLYTNIAYGLMRVLSDNFSISSKQYGCFTLLMKSFDAGTLPDLPPTRRPVILMFKQPARCCKTILLKSYSPLLHNARDAASDHLFIQGYSQMKGATIMVALGWTAGGLVLAIRTIGRVI